MLEQAFIKVYTKFKLQFYRSVFSRFGNREASLTTVETFCVEIIHALDHPTVNAFASFTGISPPNAAYKVNNLIQKGYIRKIQSTEDKREYYLEPTEKFFNYYDISCHYVRTVVRRMAERAAPEDVAAVERVLGLMTDELMPEVVLPEASSFAERKK
ncbi:MAG: MarR family transcriptional regulator [Candidatus Howiella sp.]